MSGNVEPGRSEISEPNITPSLVADTRMAPVWLVIRVYLWIEEGWHK